MTSLGPASSTWCRQSAWALPFTNPQPAPRRRHLRKTSGGGSFLCSRGWRLGQRLFFPAVRRALSSQKAVVHLHHAARYAQHAGARGLAVWLCLALLPRSYVSLSFLYLPLFSCLFFPRPFVRLGGHLSVGCAVSPVFLWVAFERPCPLCWVDRCVGTPPRPALSSCAISTLHPLVCSAALLPYTFSLGWALSRPFYPPTSRVKSGCHTPSIYASALVHQTDRAGKQADSFLSPLFLELVLASFRSLSYYSRLLLCAVSVCRLSSCLFSPYPPALG